MWISPGPLCRIPVNIMPCDYWEIQLYFIKISGFSIPRRASRQKHFHPKKYYPIKQQFYWNCSHFTLLLPVLKMSVFSPKIICLLNKRYIIQSRGSWEWLDSRSFEAKGWKEERRQMTRAKLMPLDEKNGRKAKARKGWKETNVLEKWSGEDCQGTAPVLNDGLFKINHLTGWECFVKSYENLDAIFGSAHVELRRDD